LLLYPADPRKHSLHSTAWREYKNNHVVQKDKKIMYAGHVN